MGTPKVTTLARVRRWASSGSARVIREAAGVSIREAAGPLGIAPSTLSRWERGLTSPRADAAVRWEQQLRELMEATG